MTHPSPARTPTGGTRRRPFLDRSATLVRRGYVCGYELGDRPLPAPDLVLRLGRPALLGLSTLACVNTREPVVSLTYDDGPDPEFTPRVLDELAAHGAKATFFVMVDPAEAHPGLVARMLAEGHEVALHGIDHTRLSTLPARRAQALIRAGKQRLEQVTGIGTTLFRPTYGAQTLAGYLLTRALGLEVVIWSAWARDWDGSSAEVVSGRALQSLHPGGIVLLHDASGDGVGVGLDRGLASELLLAGLRNRGYTSLTVTRLLPHYPAVRTPWFDSPTPKIWS
jgi:peptidoglycan/xylan/chitin deacetylase (PgdA/CDA1 family)